MDVGLEQGKKTVAYPVVDVGLEQGVQEGCSLPSSGCRSEAGCPRRL